MYSNCEITRVDENCTMVRTNDFTYRILLRRDENETYVDCIYKSSNTFYKWIGIFNDYSALEFPFSEQLIDKTNAEIVFDALRNKEGTSFPREVGAPSKSLLIHVTTPLLGEEAPSFTIELKPVNPTADDYFTFILQRDQKSFRQSLRTLNKEQKETDDNLDNLASDLESRDVYQKLLLKLIEKSAQKQLELEERVQQLEETNAKLVKALAKILDA